MDLLLGVVTKDDIRRNLHFNQIKTSSNILIP